MQSVKTKLSLLLIAFCLLGCNEGTRTSRPDIIFILTDDLGYNDLTCYRNANPDQPEQPPTSRTPNIDRLEEEGLRLMNSTVEPLYVLLPGPHC